RFPSVEDGFPHSEIHGSKLVRSSPWLIAAYHVLHRLCMPRHPPVALKTLDHSHCQCPSQATGIGKKDQLLEIASVTRGCRANPMAETCEHTPADTPPRERRPNRSSLHDVIQNRQ